MPCPIHLNFSLTTPGAMDLSSNLDVYNTEYTGASHAAWHSCATVDNMSIGVSLSQLI